MMIGYASFEGSGTFADVMANEIHRSFRDVVDMLGEIAEKHGQELDQAIEESSGQEPEEPLFQALKPAEERSKHRKRHEFQLSGFLDGNFEDQMNTVNGVE